MIVSLAVKDFNDRSQDSELEFYLYNLLFVEKGKNTSLNYV